MSRPIRRVLEINLTARGYDVEVAADGRSALDLARYHPDLVVLDLGLPDMDGLEVITHMGAFFAVPIVVISARGIQTAEVAALEVGADDYLLSRSL